ncbi:trans-sialidase [Trypanosoma rangeli SC58]|uniref:Trans-sialidase n=1 Tax=Trypanosoma rangeli SC58 TaxID=429131 RepID=A0A061IS77_TRYRA|nr:trans-sialidase [Trypanosoma rangeli SC58]
MDNGVTWAPYTFSGDDAGAVTGWGSYLSGGAFDGNTEPFCAFVEGYDASGRQGGQYSMGEFVSEPNIYFARAAGSGRAHFVVNTVPMRIPFRNSHSPDDLIGFFHNVSTPITRMADGTPVFPVQFLTRGWKVASTVMYLTQDSPQWTLARSASHEGCVNPALLEWENGKLLMMASCRDGRRRVYGSKDKGETWTEELGTLSRVWGISGPSPESDFHGGFITATIDGKEVILLSESEDGSYHQQRGLHLWLTDTNRIFHVGMISTAAKTASSSLLYMGGKLHCLYEESAGNNYQVRIANLAPELQRIRAALSVWARLGQFLVEQMYFGRVGRRGLYCFCSHSRAGWVFVWHLRLGPVEGRVPWGGCHHEGSPADGVHRGEVRRSWRRCAVACGPAGEAPTLPLCQLQLHACGDGVHSRGSDGQDSPGGRRRRR